MLGLYPDKLQMLRAREIVTKATVECMDVRDGACIKPCPPMRLTEFTFDINSRLRTDMFLDTQTLAMKQKWPSRSCSDPSTSPDRATSDQASSHDEVTGFIPPKSQNFQYPVDSWSGPSCSTNAVMGIARSNSQRNSQLPTIPTGRCHLATGWATAQYTSESEQAEYSQQRPWCGMSQRCGDPSTCHSRTYSQWC